MAVSVELGQILTRRIREYLKANPAKYWDAKKDAQRYAVKRNIETYDDAHAREMFSEKGHRWLREVDKFVQIAMFDIARDDAVMLLATIIPKKQKDKIRLEMEREAPSDKERLGTLFVGINVRNALRRGGFPFGSQTLDYIWYDLLKEAICLPEENVHLSGSAKEAIRKYKAEVRR